MTSQSKVGPAFLTVFGLPFLGAGLLFTIKSLQSANQPEAQRIGGAMFGLVFAIIGGGLIFGSWFGYSKLQEQARRESMSPNSPWLWRNDWAACRVESKNKTRAVGWWIGAVLLNMLSLPIALAALPNAIRAQDPKYLLPVAFELLGLIVVFGAIRATVRLERFGPAYFEMNSLPYSPGSHVSGAIHLQMQSDAPHGIDLKLSCLRRITTGSGNNRSTQSVPLWEDSKNISSASVNRDPFGAIIPVDFAIPADAFVTDNRNQNDQVLWVLTANADVPGVNYSDEFELPVFRTSSTTSTGDIAQAGTKVIRQLGQFVQTATMPGETSQEVSEPAQHRVVVSDTSNGLELYFPAGRNPGRAALIVALAAGCLGLTYAMWHIARRPPIVVFVFIGLMDFILIMASVHTAIASTRIVVGNGTLSWRKALLGIGSIHTVQVAEIEAILPVTSIQQSGSSSTFYSLKLQTKDGKNRTLVDEIVSRQEARWIAAQIEKRAGLALNTQVEIINFIYGPPPQPASSEDGAFSPRNRGTSSGNWSHAAGAMFFLGWVAFIGFMILRTTHIKNSGARAANAAAATTVPGFIRTDTMRHANLSEIATWPVQQQAEELMARAVEHDPDALQQLVQASPQWTSNLHRSDNLERLETQARYSSDLRVRRAEADLELAADGWQKSAHAVDLLMQRAKSDASYRPAALYFLGILAGDGIETERSQRFLVDYARNDPDATTREWATEGLQFVGTDQALDGLFDIFTHDSSFAVRDRAGCNVSDCGIFQRSQRMKMVPRLIDLVSDPSLNPQMKNWSFMALREITGVNLPADSAAWRHWYETNGPAKSAEFAAQPWWQVRGES